MHVPSIYLKRAERLKVSISSYFSGALNYVARVIHVLSFNAAATSLARLAHRVAG